MPRYEIRVTRDVTQSATVVVDALDMDAAQQEAIMAVRGGMHVDWEPDDCMGSDPYIADPDGDEHRAFTTLPQTKSAAVTQWARNCDQAIADIPLIDEPVTGAPIGPPDEKPERIFTPFVDTSTNKRVVMSLSDEDWSKISRGEGWSAEVTDQRTGTVVRVRGADCGAGRCFCAAEIVEIVRQGLPFETFL